jgi:tetratricopeptide (TPR) repeat protein
MLALKLAQQPDAKAAGKSQPTPPAEEQNPPEEDESLRPKEYSFNPLQAAKEIKIGDYYMKRGKYKAAIMRYTEATKWNTQSADAFFKLGEAQEKQEDDKAARIAYQHALEIEPDGKLSGEVKKRLEKLK